AQCALAQFLLAKEVQFCRCERMAVPAGKGCRWSAIRSRITHGRSPVSLSYSSSSPESTKRRRNAPGSLDGLPGLPSTTKLEPNYHDTVVRVTSQQFTV